MEDQEVFEFEDIEELVVCGECKSVIMAEEAFYDCHGYAVLCPECEGLFPENW